MSAPSGYQDLVALARELRRPLCSLIGLSDDNDPFLTDRPGVRASRAAWFADLWQRLDIKRGVHLRRIHYLLVSTPGITLPSGAAYENTIDAWRFLGRSVADARYQGLVDPSAFCDRDAANLSLDQMMQILPVVAKLLAPSAAPAPTASKPAPKSRIEPWPGQVAASAPAAPTRKPFEKALQTVCGTKPAMGKPWSLPDERAR